MVSFSGENQMPIFGRGLLLLALLLTFSSLLRGASAAPTTGDVGEVDGPLLGRGEEGLAASILKRSGDLAEREASPDPKKKKHKGKKNKNATAAADPAAANAKVRRSLFSSSSSDSSHDHSKVKRQDAAAAANGTDPNANVQQMLPVNVPELSAGILDMMAGTQVMIDGMTIMLQALGVNPNAMNQIVQVQPNAMANMMAALNQATVQVIPVQPQTVQKRGEDDSTKMNAKRKALKAGEAY